MAYYVSKTRFDNVTIKLFTSHKSDSVRYYKHPSESLLQAASTTVMSGGSENVDQKPAALKADFDIDEYKLDKPVSVHVSNDECKPVHKKPCLRGDDCGGICEFLKAVDRKNMRECQKRSLKSVKLSVKFCK